MPPYTNSPTRSTPSIPITHLIRVPTNTAGLWSGRETPVVCERPKSLDVEVELDVFVFDVAVFVLVLLVLVLLDVCAKADCVASGAKTRKATQIIENR